MLLSTPDQQPNSVSTIHQAGIKLVRPAQGWGTVQPNPHTLWQSSAPNESQKQTLWHPRLQLYYDMTPFWTTPCTGLIWIPMVSSPYEIESKADSLEVQMLWPLPVFRLFGNYPRPLYALIIHQSSIVQTQLSVRLAHLDSRGDLDNFQKRHYWALLPAIWHYNILAMGKGLSHMLTRAIVLPFQHGISSAKQCTAMKFKLEQIPKEPLCR